MAKTPLTLEQMVTVVGEHMYFSGYRPVREDDLTPGGELVMVDVVRFCEEPNEHIDPRHAAGCVTIKLDKNPVSPAVTEDLARTKVVFYHCVRDGALDWQQCWTPIRDILRTNFERNAEDPFMNDTRWFIKR